MVHLPRSGNSVVDAQDDAEEEAIRQLHTLDCGCYKRCSCDNERED